MGPQVQSAYLRGKPVKSPDFRAAACSAPLPVLMDAYFQVAASALHGARGYESRLTAIHNAMLVTIAARAVGQEFDRARMRAAIERATRESLHRAAPVYLYFNAARALCQSEVPPDVPGLVIKCERGRRYGLRIGPRAAGEPGAQA